MGHLAQREGVDKAIFRFLPDNLLHYENMDVYGSDPDAVVMEEVYQFCHQWVFEHKAPGKIGLNRRAILERVRESETSIKLFFLANMLAWQQSHETEPFHAKVLTGDFAVHQVKTFAASCRKQFGAFDTTTLDRLMGSDVAKQDFEGLLLSSEMTAGNFIIGYKMFHSGTVSQTLYREKEGTLHPYWLAVEQTYYDDLLHQHIRRPDPNLSPVLAKHRWNTLHILGQLKRHSRQAVAVFLARERIMPEAVKRVLVQHGYAPEDFMIERRIVTSPLKFWSRLAVAIQQVELLDFVDGNPSIFDS